jgi:hypothetical protein
VSGSLVKIAQFCSKIAQTCSKIDQLCPKIDQFCSKIAQNGTLLNTPITKGILLE